MNTWTGILLCALGLVQTLPSQGVDVKVLKIGPPLVLRASVPQARLEADILRRVPASIDVPGKIFGNVLIWRAAEAHGLVATPARDSFALTVGKDRKIEVSCVFDIAGKVKYQYEHVKVVWKKWGIIKRPVVQRDWRWTNGTVSASLHVSIPFSLVNKAGSTWEAEKPVAVVLQADSKHATAKVRNLKVEGINTSFKRLVEGVGARLVDKQARNAILEGVKKVSVDITERLRVHLGKGTAVVTGSGSDTGMLWVDLQVGDG